jgi:hypothetical protein
MSDVMSRMKEKMIKNGIPVNIVAVLRCGDDALV